MLYSGIHFQFLSYFPHRTLARSVFSFKMKTNNEIKFVFKTCSTLLDRTYLLQREILCPYLYLIWYMIIFKFWYYLMEFILKDS